MAALPLALLAAVGDERVRCDAPVTAIGSEDGGHVIGVGEERLLASAVVVATPPAAAAAMLRDTAPSAADELAAIHSSTTGTVLLVYPKGTGDALPEAAGLVVPLGKAPMTAASFVSRTWPKEGFGSRAVIRCTVGGIDAEDVVEARDEQIVEAVCRHLSAVLRLPPEPEASAVVRWPDAIPQYGIGHLERVERIGAALPAGIFVTGNAYRGVGLTDVVRDADETARRVLVHLARDHEPTEREHVR